VNKKNAQNKKKIFHHVAWKGHWNHYSVHASMPSGQVLLNQFFFSFSNCFLLCTRNGYEKLYKFFAFFLEKFTIFLDGPNWIELNGNKIQWWSKLSVWELQKIQNETKDDRKKRSWLLLVLQHLRLPIWIRMNSLVFLFL